MPADNKLELVVTVDTDKANASIKSVNAGLSSIETSAVNAARGASRGIDGMTAAMVKGATAGNLLADAIKRALGWVKEFTAGWVMLAAQNAKAEAADAQTLEQKPALEQRKAAIEIEYLDRVHEIKQRLFDLETSRMVLEEEANLRRLGYHADEIQARIAELTQQREDIRHQQQEATDAAIQAARENAAIRQAELIRDHNRQIFESLKRQAEGVFDALLTRSQSVWSAIANALKTAVLTAIKEIVTSRVAALNATCANAGLRAEKP